MKLKDIKLKKIIYPALSGLFFLAVIVIFIYSARFLSTSLQRSFDIDEGMAESRIARLDMDSFYRVAKKLNLQLTTNNLQLNQQQEVESEAVASESSVTITVATGTAATISTEIATSTATTSAPVVPPPPPDKSLVKISVLNGTKTAGLAGDLKNILTADGWTVANTGNASAAAKTFIKIKASKNNYSDLIRDSVSKKYTLAANQTLNESDEYDIIIIIGK